MRLSRRFPQAVILALALTTLSAPALQAACPGQDAARTAFRQISEVLTATEATIKDFFVALYETWRDDWKKQTRAQQMARDLIKRGYSFEQMEKALEAEGLAEYLVMQAGRPSALSGKEIVSLLEKEGWLNVRVSGSHFIMKAPSGATVPVPVHGNDSLGVGLLHSILKKAGLLGQK